MIIEILMLVAAAIIFVVLARRYPATEAEVPARVKGIPSSQRSTEANRMIARTKHTVGRMIDPLNIFLANIFSGIKKLRLPKRSKHSDRTFEIVPGTSSMTQIHEAPVTKNEPHDTTDHAPLVIAREASDSSIGQGERLLADADEQFKQKHWEKAEQLYLKAVLHLPKEPKIYSRLGVIYLEKKNYHDAKEAFLTALQYDDGVASRYYNLALAHAGLGDRKKSLVAVKKALDIDSGNEKYIRLMEKLVE